MGIISFKEVQPVLPSQDVSKSIAYYTGKLGFKLVFQDDAENPKYAGVRRENIELHFQWHEASEWESVERPMLRFVIQGIDNLYKEYELVGVFHKNTMLQITPWGTKEFAFYDLNMNGLAFYEDV
jgi:catechol 2,3-dioxygenase-like lactoylglutathione lyase family enzyme